MRPAEKCLDNAHYKAPPHALGPKQGSGIAPVLAIQGAIQYDDGVTLSTLANRIAWTCCDYADTLLQRNASGDRAKATALLDESLAISNELGMRPLMGRALSFSFVVSHNIPPLTAPFVDPFLSWKESQVNQ